MRRVTAALRAVRGRSRTFMRSMFALIRSSRCCSYSFTGAGAAQARDMAGKRNNNGRPTGPGRRAREAPVHALAAGRSERPHRLGRGAQRVVRPSRARAHGDREASRWPLPAVATLAAFRCAYRTCLRAGLCVGVVLACSRVQFAARFLFAPRASPSRLLLRLQIRLLLRGAALRLAALPLPPRLLLLRRRRRRLRLRPEA